MPTSFSVRTPAATDSHAHTGDLRQDERATPRSGRASTRSVDAQLAVLPTRTARTPEVTPPAQSTGRRLLRAFGLGGGNPAASGEITAASASAADLEAGLGATGPRPTRATPSAMGSRLSSYPTASTADTNTLLGALEHAIGECRSRPVDRQAAAELVNTLRLQRRDGAVGNRTMMANAARHSDDWYRAQGLNEADIRQVHHAAFVSGTIYPGAGLLANLGQFFVSPFLSAGTGKPWVGTGTGMVIAGALQTPMYAAQQPVVVQFVEHTAERNGPVIQVDKNHIHHKEWLPGIATRASAQAARLDDSARAFADALDTVLARIPSGSRDNAAQPAGHDEARLAAWLEANRGDADAERLQASARAFAEALTALRDLHEGVLMTEAGHTRQQIGSRFQSISRILRPVFQGLVSLASGVPKSEAAAVAAGLAQRVARLDSRTIAVIQAFGALALTGFQHISAGYDEVAKVNYKNALNLIYGDFFTEDGNRRIAAGETVTADDIDEDKLRGLIASPAQSLVKRVTKSLDAEIARVEAQRDAAPASSAQHAALDAAIATMKRDRARLKDNDLAGLSEGGHARTTLATNAAALLPGVRRDSWRNLNADELGTQVAQRLGQTFHMFGFGSFAASSVGRIVAAAADGSSHLASTTIGGLAVAGTGLGAIAAYSQGTTTTIKNHGKEAEPRMSLGRQTFYGVFALPFDLLGSSRAWSANRQAATAMQAAQRQMAMANVVLGLSAAMDGNHAEGAGEAPPTAPPDA